MNNLTVLIYEEKYKIMWNEFVKKAKNGLFLFDRDYLEYHADRFEDFSLMFFLEGKLIAIMPANISGTILYSHQGLTYGGIISSVEMTTPLMIRLFEVMIRFLKQKTSIETIIYKALPYIYSSIPSQEDLYALFLYGANLTRRDISSSITCNHRIKFSELRRRGIKKAEKQGLKISETTDYELFMSIVKENLLIKHNTIPTHTSMEIELLHDRFPDNIRLFSVYNNKKMLAGIIIYESKYVAHSQYIAANEEGKKVGALDYLVNYLVEYYSSKSYFDFGISTENSGRSLNEGLIRQKEMFGARAITYDFYELSI